MAEDQIYLNDLNANSREYKVKIKVVEKGRPVTSPVKGTKYQTVILEDDKGNRMRGALFGDQIESFKEALLYNGVYEIANAPIKACPEKYRFQSSSLAYQMTFGSKTAIHPLNPDDAPHHPDYQTIVQIPRAGSSHAKFAVLAVVLFTEPVPRKIVRLSGQELLVTEIVATDHSTGQPLIISAWNDLAESCSEAAASWTGQFTVIGFTALRTASYKGFSLSTTMSTEIIHAPEGESAQALTKWVAANMSVLVDRQKRVLAVRNPGPGRKVISVEALRMKKAGTTLQEERHWIRVTVVAVELEKINAYTGCSVCGYHTEVLLGMVYACTTCQCTDCTAVPRVAFNCEVSDGTATLPITAFSGDMSKLCRMTVTDLHKLKHDDDQFAFDAVKNLLQNRPVLLEVGPNAALSKSNILQWNLKSVVIEGDEDQEPFPSNASLKDVANSTKEITTPNNPDCLSEENCHTISKTSQLNTDEASQTIQLEIRIKILHRANDEALPVAKKIKKEPVTSKPPQKATP